MDKRRNPCQNGTDLHRESREATRALCPIRSLSLVAIIPRGMVGTTREQRRGDPILSYVAPKQTSKRDSRCNIEPDPVPTWRTIRVLRECIRVAARRLANTRVEKVGSSGGGVWGWRVARRGTAWFLSGAAKRRDAIPRNKSIRLPALMLRLSLPLPLLFSNPLATPYVVSLSRNLVSAASSTRLSHFYYFCELSRRLDRQPWGAKCIRTYAKHAPQEPAERSR